MGGTARQTKDDAPEDVGVEGLLSLRFLKGLAPVGRSELEDAFAGPVRNQAEQVRTYVKGLILCRPQLARGDTKVALTSPPSWLPTKASSSARPPPGAGSAPRCCS